MAIPSRVSSQTHVSLQPRYSSSVGAGHLSGKHSGQHKDRKQRFDLRAAKRWGGLDLFEIPTPLLWLEDGCVANLLEPGVCAAQPVMNLWP